MKRRSLLIASPLALLTACSGVNPFTQKVQIDLATAQQWAQLLTSSFDGFVIATAGSIPPSVEAGIAETNKLLDAANEQIQGLTGGSLDAKEIVASGIKLAHGLLTALQPFVPALAVSGPLYPEIEAGFVVLSAFVDAIAINPPVAPADATHLQAAAQRGVALKAVKR